MDTDRRASRANARQTQRRTTANELEPPSWADSHQIIGRHNHGDSL